MSLHERLLKIVGNAAERDEQAARISFRKIELALTEALEANPYLDDFTERIDGGWRVATLVVDMLKQEGLSPNYTTRSGEDGASTLCIVINDLQKWLHGAVE